MTPAADVIAAIATASGRAGIGVVRVSGARLDRFAERLLGRVPPPRRAVRAVFADAAGAAIDDGLALYFPAPHSYTGEDVLELQGHGGPVVMRMLLARCVELGARLAEPGEFTRRAFLNDRLDLAQAESVADLIDASTEAAARSALRSLQGEFSARVQRVLDGLIELRMLVEATLDFPEEEIDTEDRADVQRRLDRVRATLDETLAGARQGSLLRNGIHVVHNKIDLAGGAPGVEGDAVRLSARTGEGVELLRRRLLEIAGWRDAGSDTFMARERHVAALLHARDRLEAAAAQLGQPELFAEELRLAQGALNEITGEFSADDLLGEIFSRFCIGK